MNSLRKYVLILWIGLASVAGANPDTAAAPHRFEKEIAAFEGHDKAHPPPQGAILFLGSSTIRKWTTLADDFPGHTVLNRGFGGSFVSDSVYFFDRVVLPYKPKLIVFYAGSNDLNAGKPPETVANDFKIFVRKVETELPGTRVDFISISTSPSRWKDLEKVKEANQLISSFIAGDKKLSFINTFPAMLDKDGKPRPELYVGDRLHMNPKGYAIWTPIIAPYLNRAE